LTITNVSHNSITTLHDHTITGGGRIEGEWIFEPVEKDVEDEEPAPEVYVSWKRSKDMTYLPVIGKLMGWRAKKRMAKTMEASLLRLKALSEALEEEKAPFVLVDLPMQRVLSIVDSCAIDNIGDKLRELYTELNVFVSLSNLEYGGQPITIYHDWRPDENFTVLEAAIPLLAESVIVNGRIQWRRMPEGPALKGSHYGLFSESDLTHRRMERWIAKEGLVKRGSPWEVYITDPTTELDTSKWETRIYYPVEGP
jgi:effector-binding domain-containing protein